ncbi:DUF5312 family protein [Treponema pedis]|uniref:Uncharacterized protein n=1 Tax=Treponema pedis TaxID=409322 RepID=A0A7S7AWN9_9SPIR|nr:DUF5312 family protein [Treponema pedis]QOW60919.1 hypothetical protein IFE08_00375 [Treponema pedis]
MERTLSTFDQLVKSLSKEETKSLLDSISAGMQNFVPETSDSEQEDSDSLFLRQTPAMRLSDEPFFIRLWISLRSFLRSIPIETLHNEELLRRLGKTLRRTAGNYIVIGRNIYIKDFYDGLKSLRKTQLFFSSMLSSYDSFKSSFYMLLSSFIAPATYEKLIKETDPFSVKIGSEVSGAVRTNFLRKIDAAFSNLTDEEKSEMYRTAQALEWMRSFCDLQLDKTLLRFSIISKSEVISPTLTVQPEMEILSSVLSSKKNIPQNLLQVLFLMQSQEKMPDDEIKLKTETDDFIKQAVEALSNIKTFTNEVPLLDMVRYVKKDINWLPYKIEGGEDWFIYFKQSWYERFNQKWSTWSYEQKKYDIKIQMISLLKVDDLNTLRFYPWKNLWVNCSFKKELQFLFLKTFFSSFYYEKLSPSLKIILVEGNFARIENLNEYTTAYNVLEHRKGEFDAYENRLSPIGDIGTAFAKIRNEKSATLKNKNQIESLMRTIESEARQLMVTTLEAIKSIDNVLSGIIGGGKTNLYATLINWSALSGTNGGKFHDEIIYAKESLHKVIDLFSLAEKLETEAK